MTDTLEQIIAKRRECQAQVDAIRNRTPGLPICWFGQKNRMLITESGGATFQQDVGHGMDQWQTLFDIEKCDLKNLAEMLTRLFYKPWAENRREGEICCAECNMLMTGEQTAVLCQNCAGPICMSCEGKHKEYCK